MTIIIYLLLYLFVGAIIAVCSWLFMSKEHCNEGSVLIYLPVAMVLWPAIVINFVFNLITFIQVTYMNDKN